MKKVDVAISFDTTGSMYPCLSQVRNNITNVVNELFLIDNIDLKISIIAHGDYCDAKTTYVTKILDLTDNKDMICRFVQKVEPTYGGDSPECYELVLHQARTDLSWRSGATKILTIIGDDVPHESDYKLNTLNINWQNELGLLIEAGINVYGVHAMPGIRSHSKYFYMEIANKTNGFYLTLDQFSEVNQLLLAICYSQSDDVTFTNFKTKCTKTRSFQRTLATLSGEKFDEHVYIKEYKDKGLTPIESGRFQAFIVSDPVPIKQFVEERGITFKKGRGFYQLTGKTVEVQQYKEIILQDKSTGDYFNGPEARHIIGLSPQTVKGGITEKLHPLNLDKYNIYIQSTSVNRKLLPDSKFLYEVID